MKRWCRDGWSMEGAYRSSARSIAIAYSLPRKQRFQSNPKHGAETLFSISIDGKWGKEEEWGLANWAPVKYTCTQTEHFFLPNQKLKTGWTGPNQLSYTQFSCAVHVNNVKMYTCLDWHVKVYIRRDRDNVQFSLCQKSTKVTPKSVT